MRKNQLLTRKLMAVAVASALSVGLASQVLAEEQATLSLDIKKQSINKSLMDLTKSSGVQVVLSEGISENKELHSIKGEYKLTDALGKMLEGTGLSYQFISDETVLITEDGDGSGDGEGSAAENKEVEELVVTGSRIRNTKPTSHVIMMDRDYIDRLGAATAADIIASLPQNFNGVNRSSTTTNGGENATPFGTLGESSANLRGVGAEGTLVLVNGRRTASSPGFEADGRVNLGTIPAAAIERVEVMLDGASAIYGSDAIGGVINFIMRKDYVGATTKVRYEDSVNNADNYSLSQTVGFSWDSGSVLGTLTYREEDGVSSFDAGWDTSDWRSRGGYDNRRVTNQFYAYYDANGVYNYLGNRYFDPASAGKSSYDVNTDLLATPTDRDAAAALGLVLDYPKLKLQGTPTTKTKSATLNVHQDITDNLEVYADVLFSEVDNYAMRGPFATGFIRIPSTNPFNKFGVDIQSSGYSFIDEYLNDGMRGADQSTTQTRKDFTLGVKYDLGIKDWQLDAYVSRSTEESEYVSYAVPTRVPGEAWFSALHGIQMEFVGYNGNTAVHQPVLDANGNTIAVPAFDPFNGNHDPDLNLNDLPVNNAGFTPKSITERIDISADGELFEIPGGIVRMSVNASHGRDTLDWSGAPVRVSTTGAVDDKMKRDVTAFATELSVPLVGENNALPFMDSLVLSLAARYDDYTFTGHFSGVGQPEEERSYDNISPRIGLAWELSPELTLRASKGESFLTPSMRWMYDDQQIYPTTVYDYFHPSPETAPNGVYVASIDWWYVITPNVPIVFGGNPDLKAETSTNTTIGFTYEPAFLEGLKISANWNQIEWDGRLQQLRYNDVAVARNPELFPDLVTRDPITQEITRGATMPINAYARLNESIDLDISYQRDTEIGFFDFGLYAVETLVQRDQLVPTIDPYERIGLQNGSDRYKVQGRASWSGDKMGFTLWANWRGGYKLVNRFGDPVTTLPRMPHATTYDLTGHYDMPEHGLKVNFGAKNILNREFDFTGNGPSPWDGYRHETRGRMIYLEATKEFSLR
ncbi:TonB-dependent receptor [Porticoccaceae bacterium LTM1]|nr:TonB-dependent receptor [Porticoccaceae bacterium LTM1]